MAEMIVLQNDDCEESRKCLNISLFIKLTFFSARKLGELDLLVIEVYHPLWFQSKDNLVKKPMVWVKVQ